MINFEKLSKILFHAITVGVFFVLFAPLFMSNQFFFPFIVPRNVLFRVAVEVIFFSWLLLAYINPQFRPDFKNWKQWNKLIWLVSGFFVITVVAAILGINFTRSFWSNYERMGGVFHLAHLLAFFFVLINIYKTKKDWHVAMSFSLFLALLMTLLAFAQWLEVPLLLKSAGSTRLTATTGNPIFLAAYLIFNLFFVLYFLIKKSAFSFKTFAVGFLVFDGYLILASVLGKVADQADWGFLNFLKAPLLSELFVRALNFGSSFDSHDVKASAILLLGYLVLQVGVFGVWYFQRIKHVIAGFLVFLAFSYLFIIYNTQTRGAILGILTGLGFLALVSLFLNVSKKIKYIGLAFLAFALVTPLLLVVAKDTAFVKHSNTLNRLASISLADTTTETRFLTWQAGWKGMTAGAKEFLIGYGPDNFYYVFDKNFPVAIYKDAGSQIWFDRAHNILVEVALTTGVIGLVLYVLILVLAAWMLFQTYKRQQYSGPSFILVGLLVAFLVQNLFVFDTLNTDILFYFLLAFIIFLYQDSQHGEGRDLVQEAISQPVSINYIYVSLVVVILAAGLTFNFRTLQANNYIYRGLISGNSAESSQDLNDSLDLFKKAINQSVIGRFEARQQLASFVGSLSRQNNVPPELIVPMINFAVDELQKSVNEEPTSTRNYIFLSSFYNATARFNNSYPQRVISLLEPTAINLSPTRPQLYEEVGQAYAYLGNFDKSYEYFEKASSLAPHVIDERWNLITIAIVFQRFDLAEKIFSDMKTDLSWQPTSSDYERLVGLYTRVDGIDKMIKLQEGVVTKDPTPQNFIQLASLYAKVGENTKARQAVKQAITLDPSFEQQTQEFLKNLDAGELLEHSN